MIRYSETQKDTIDKHSYIADLAENDNSIALRYKDEQGNHFMVLYKNGVLKLKCEGESTSNLELIEGEWTKVELETPFGNMVLRSKAKELSHSKNHLFVRYVLYQEDELIDEISLKWNLLRTGIS